MSELSITHPLIDNSAVSRCDCDRKRQQLNSLLSSLNHYNDGKILCFVTQLIIPLRLQLTMMNVYHFCAVNVFTTVYLFEIFDNCIALQTVDNYFLGRRVTCKGQSAKYANERIIRYFRVARDIVGTRGDRD